MSRIGNSMASLGHLIAARADSLGPWRILGISLAIAAGTLSIAEAAARVGELAPQAQPLARQALAALAPEPAPAPATWDGRDLDGDGAPDFANPTGLAPRGHDAFGDGFFHASRDGGARAHEGVDYVSEAGQTVAAPISGYVSRIGYAYPGDSRYRYVEIQNPALRLEARVFYVEPDVAVGDTVALGHPIGRARSLQGRYPGITDHIHLELARSGSRLDAQQVIVASNEGAFRTAMN